MNKNINAIKSFKELIIFATPSIIMMVFSSSYTIVDGLFISSLVGTDAFTAISLIYPIISFFIAFGVMFASGSAALLGKFLGEKREKEANVNFTAIWVFVIILSLILMGIVYLFLNQLLHLLGTDNNTHQHALDYMHIYLLFIPCAITQLYFQSNFITASKPHLGLATIIIAGITNIVLDYLFMSTFHMGMYGAALATGIGYSLTTIIGLIFFLSNKKGLRFTRFHFDFKNIFQAGFNGSSEMVSNLANATTTIIFNVLMLKLVGNEGVNAMSVLLYCQYLLTSFFMGYSLGIAPVISYNYGALNEKKVRQFYKSSYRFIFMVGLIMLGISLIIARPLALLFANDSQKIAELITKGMYIFSISFLFGGLNIFSSALFTALSDGKTSAIISFLRTFVFIIISTFTLSYLFKVDGLLSAITVAETLTLITTILIFKKAYNKAFTNLSII